MAVAIRQTWPGAVRGFCSTLVSFAIHRAYTQCSMRYGIGKNAVTGFVTTVFFRGFSCTSMAKEKIINIRVDAELKKKAKKLAENDGRSLSNWILRLIQNEITKSSKRKSGAESS